MDRALSGDLLSASLSGYNGGLSLISKRVRADAELADSLPESLRITPQKQPPAHGPRTVVRREGRPEPAVLSQPTADVQTRPPLNALCPRACPAQSFLPRARWPGHALPTPHLCACPALSPSCSTVQLESPPPKAHQACGRAAPAPPRCSLGTWEPAPQGASTWPPAWPRRPRPLSRRPRESDLYTATLGSSQPFFSNRTPGLPDSQLAMTWALAPRSSPGASAALCSPERKKCFP